MKLLRTAILSVTLLALAAVQPAHAILGLGDIVFDPKNFAQNLLAASRALSQIRNQVRQLRNEARMLTNMARHLERLDISKANDLRFALGQIRLLTERAERIALAVEATEQAWRTHYPAEFTEAVTSDQLLAGARERWANAHEAYRQSLVLEARVVQDGAADAAMLQDLMSASQAATGSLEAAQAGNELLGLTAKQLIAGQTLMAAHFRARDLEAARQLMERKAAETRLKAFLGAARAYAPGG